MLNHRFREQSRKKTRLGKIGTFRLLLGHQQFRLRPLTLGDISLSDDVAENVAMRHRSTLFGGVEGCREVVVTCGDVLVRMGADGVP